LKFGLLFCSKESQFQFAFQWDWFIILNYNWRAYYATLALLLLIFTMLKVFLIQCTWTKLVTRYKVDL
jgi:hypothetical protein